MRILFRRARPLVLRTFSFAALIGTSFAGNARAATTVVGAGADLQAALNAAQPGDELVLQAGARFLGSFRLPAKAAGPVITIRSSATLPDRRITPQDASLLPTLASPVVSAVDDGPGAANGRHDRKRFE
jgi:hypothetical protein